MASSSRPRRKTLPVRKYGFCDSSSDDSLRDEDSVHSDSSVHSEVTSSSDLDDNSVDSNSSEEHYSDWKIVSSGADEHHVLQFSAVAGYVNGENPESVIDYVSLFLPQKLFTALCGWTNSRAMIALAQSFLTGSILEWKEVSENEMKVFLGLTFAIGIIRKPTIRLYWATDLLMKSEYFPKCMCRDRYLAILKYVRFSDPHNSQPNDRNSRLVELDNLITEICSLYTPDQNLCLDETLLLHKGRLGFKMFIRTKRPRFGIKSFMLCDSLGYMLCSVTYYGAQTDMSCQEPLCQDLSKSEKIVVILLAKVDMLDKGYIVSLDNWFCSERLAAYLWTRKTGMRGTVRIGRGVPKLIQNKQVKKYDSVYARKSELLAVKFVDRKDVYVLSTVDSASDVPRERFVNNGRIEYKKPSAIAQYNRFMGGIDLTDQLLASCNCIRKSHIWFKKVGLNMLQRLLLNAFIRYKSEKNRNAVFSQFSMKAVTFLTGVQSEPTHGRHSRLQIQHVPEGGDQLEVFHYLDFIMEDKADKRSRPRKQCRVCSGNSIRKDTFYCCVECQGRPALCVVPCFKIWHQAQLH